MAFPSVEAKQAYYDALPRKRSAVGVIIIQDNKILTLEPTYKLNWLVPGGVVEKSESPLEAALRECKEEIGVDVEVLSFLCADYKRGDEYIGDAVHYIFHAKIPEGQNIELAENEIKQALWLPFEEALAKFDHHLGSRIRVGLQAIEARGSYYCEEGEIKF